MENKKFDHLEFDKDKSIRSEIKEETLMFSDKIIKINRYNMSQERQIVITDKALYNFKKKSLKRRLDITNIKGLTIATYTDEFVVHGNDSEYDYDYVSSKRKDILQILSIVFKQETKNDLIIIELDEKSLKSIVTLKSEKKKDSHFSRMPITQNKPDSDNNQPVHFEDFQIISVVGKGSFGKVCLVKYIKTGETYAMKSIKKHEILEQEQIENTILEKKILEQLNHPFLCTLEFYFQTYDRIFFIMNFVRGGELFQHLKNEKIFDVERTKFYAAQIGLALDFLHSKGIVYRDLKPENILMNSDGYLQLADFGMAKSLSKNEKAQSFCGTPEYLAPEVINCDGHDYMADWWSYGILVYEMLTGLPPFYDTNQDKMYNKITTKELTFTNRVSIPDDAKDLLIQLLEKNQNKRIGKKNGFKEIKEHKFFAGFDFEKLLSKKLEAPFIPNLEDQFDVHNFDDMFTNESLKMTAIPDKDLKEVKKNEYLFKGFDKK